MSETAENLATKDEKPTKEGEGSFNEEIKDYAKTTMNELLGMFGYDEEMTTESVSSLEIKVPDPPDEAKRIHSPTPMVASALPPPISSATLSTAPVVSTTSSNIPPILISPDLIDESSDDSPIIVKVEGSTSASDVVRKQNGAVQQNMISTPVPATVAASLAAVSSATLVGNKQQPVEPALAPHFYATPPAVRGVFCVVANLPMVDNQGKSAMTFKFWNCITCSEYFLQKPEVVFRVQYPHLFVGQPEWLYQAAVCVGCHQKLRANPPATLAPIPHHQSKATYKVVACGPDKKPLHEEATIPVSMASSSLAAADRAMLHAEDHNNGSRVQINGSRGPARDNANFISMVLEDELETDSAEEATDAKESYKCYICSKSVKEHSQPWKLRRSKFSSLFTELPDNVGHYKVCNTCFDRLNRQRDRYVQGNVPDSDRDYVAQIKASTGIDITCKSASTYTPIICFVCDRGTEDSKEPSRPIFRSRYPTLFRNLPDSVIHLPICDKCYKKLQKVKLRYDNMQASEEERDYVQFINMWRAKKGLGKHNVFI